MGTGAGEERALAVFKRVGSKRNRGKVRNFAIEKGLKGGSQEKRCANLELAGGLA